MCGFYVLSHLLSVMCIPSPRGGAVKKHVDNTEYILYLWIRLRCNWAQCAINNIDERSKFQVLLWAVTNKKLTAHTDHAELFFQFSLATGDKDSQIALISSNNTIYYTTKPWLRKWYMIVFMLTMGTQMAKWEEIKPDICLDCAEPKWSYKPKYKAVYMTSKARWMPLTGKVNKKGQVTNKAWKRKCQ